MATAYDLYDILRDIYITAMRISRYYLYGEFSIDRAVEIIRSLLGNIERMLVPITYHEYYDRLETVTSFEEIYDLLTTLFTEIEDIAKKVEIPRELLMMIEDKKRKIRELIRKAQRGEISESELEKEIERVKAEEISIPTKPAEAPITIEKEITEAGIPPLIQDIDGLFERLYRQGWWDEKVRNSAIEVLKNEKITYYGIVKGLHTFNINNRYWTFIPYYEDIFEDLSSIELAECTCEEYKDWAVKEHRFCKHIMAVLIHVLLDVKIKDKMDETQHIYEETKKEIIEVKIEGR